MREKILNFMYQTTNGSFEKLISDISVEGITESEQPGLEPFITTVKEKLTAHRSEFENAAIGIYEKHFTEAEIDALSEIYSMDVMKKFSSLTMELGNDLVVAAAKWRNDSLDKYTNELTSLVPGLMESAPAPLPAAPSAA